MTTADTGPSEEAARQIELGCDLADAGDHVEAIEAFEKAVGLGEAWVALNLGNSFREIGELERARQAFEHAWRIGEDPDAAYNLANALVLLGADSDAEKLRAELRQEAYPLIVIEDAIDLSQAGKVDEALAALRPIAESPSHHSSHRDYAAGVIGHLLFHREDPSAEEWLLRGAESYPSARDDLGELYSTRGEEKAWSVWQRGAALGEPESAVPLANAYWEAGRHEEAIRVLVTVAELDAHAAENLAMMRDDR